MANLTTKELAGLEDELAAEKLLVQKYRLYAASTTDPQIKSKCEEIAAKHQNHYDQLFMQLG